MSRSKTHEALAWLRANDHILGALTGTDMRILLAIDACWQALPYCENAPIIAAVRALAPQMQDKTRYLARELIARALDWDDRDRIWSLVVYPYVNHPGPKVTP